ncbi:monofunctional biosynthetic peptidoglycan transglycosylase [Flavobacterium zepuense]|uniref:Biosynthetic peptidoglycan transglycosylase n=1 Tax=Flavobacterium zepuense TaxID=2593302 RepID=A0A552UVY8_9FLAO|nr:monofunctional biosynthetic peptidoglycan transglycosylase [Flavobacterium zepuense]TRW22414.1 monofunctional biosynthetic peptidoglycan transglycosylase [Flavobacterium zepuense]
MFKKILRLLYKLMLWFVVVSVLSVLLLRFIPIPFTPLMISRAFEQKADGREMHSSHDWVPIEEISPNLQKAVIASEDDKFLTHHGFNFDAMYKAYKGNKKGKKIKGGSTISQQTAKNVFLWQGRSYVRKVMEAYFTVLIELLWSKERIMEVYLNSIEMGEGVYGAQAAAEHWFHKDAASLTRREAASIAAILPNPLKYRATKSSRYIERRKGRIVKLMRYVKLEY